MAKNTKTAAKKKAGNGRVYIGAFVKPALARALQGIADAKHRGNKSMAIELLLHDAVAAAIRRTN